MTGSPSKHNRVGLDTNHNQKLLQKEKNSPQKFNKDYPFGKFDDN